MAGIYVTGKLGLYASRMHGRSTHATVPVPFVEGNGKEDVRRLRSAIGDKGLIWGTLKVGIV
jgi:hypothetical protein